MLKRSATVIAALIAAVGLLAADADARVGSGKSVGSRGSNTYSAPPTTNTAPRAAQPVAKAPTQSATAGAATAAQQPARRGFGSMLMGGLLGAGLFGLLSGAGLFSGLGSMAGVLGFLLQMAIIGGIVALVMAYFRNRNAMAMAGAGANATQRPMAGFAREGAAMGGGSAAPALAKINVTGDDFNAFERLLGNIQGAYGKQDRNALRALTTQEMFHHFDDDLTANESKRITNRISGVKLLQGDLAEAWGEPGAEYATVAMRYAIDDRFYDAAGKEIGQGEPEVTEIWTFRRNPGANAMSWKLSAIQQA